MSSGEEKTVKGNKLSNSRQSRSEKLGKRRKTNLILNLLIGLVILLIVVVSSAIFLGGNDNEAAIEDKSTQTEQNSEKTEAEKAPSKKDESTKETAEDRAEIEDNVPEEQPAEETADDEQEEEVAPADKEQEVVKEGGDGEDVAKTVVNPSWKPIGTTQTGEHANNFDTESTDWKEMLQAVSYATGLGQDQMTLWYLGNNGHNKAVATISPKGQKEKSRVYIDWVDGQGWKPTKIEQVTE